MFTPQTQIHSSAPLERARSPVGINDIKTLRQGIRMMKFQGRWELACDERKDREHGLDFTSAAPSAPQA